MQFLYMLAGWEGSASDSCMFEDALQKGFTIPKDRYYLANAGYHNCDPLLVPSSVKKTCLIPTYSLLTPKIRGIRCSKME